MRALITLAVWSLAATFVLAHDLDHIVTGAEARVIQLRYADGAAFSYESYELFRPGETTPFQVGRTDALGRVVFVPDAEGEWRIRAFSEDGHGADFRFAAAASAAGAGAPSTADRWGRASLGIGIILALFGSVSLLRFRRKTT